MSSLGNIRRLPKTVVDSIGRQRFIPGHILRKYNSPQGYDYVTLSKDGVCRSEFVQRVVAITFVKNDDPEHKKEVNHIDENKKNNRADNLEWVTSSENKKHGTGIQRMLIERKKRGGRFAEKKVGKFSKSGALIAIYKSASEAARQNATDFSSICACCREGYKKKTHLGYIWKYIE